MLKREIFNEYLDFPPYFLSEDYHHKIIVAGGGGSSKTGIPNQIVCMNNYSEFIFPRIIIPKR